MTDFNGRPVLVTGASGGIGGATVRHLVEAGADVIASGRSKEEALETLAADTGARVLPFDLTSEESVRDALDGLDVWGVVNCAGYGGEIAVIYTANDYGDMWQFGIDEKGAFDLSVDEKRRYIAINRGMWDMRNIYFRNIEPKPLFDTYKFGTNVIIHLVTRWEDKIRNVPMGNPPPSMSTPR